MYKQFTAFLKFKTNVDEHAVPRESQGSHIISPWEQINNITVMWTRLVVQNNLPWMST